MDPQESKIALIGGALAVGVGLLFVKSSKSSSTYVAPGTGAATAIAAAQESDYALGEQTKVALANTAAGVFTNSDNNSTSLKLAAITGASSADLAALAAKSTYDTTLLNDQTQAAKNVLDYNATTYQAKLTGIAQHDTNVTDLSEAKIAQAIAATTSGDAIKIAQVNSSGALGIAKVASTTALGVAKTQYASADYVAREQTYLGEAQAVQQAQAEVQVSGNEASASKSASMWGGISGLVGGLAKAIPFFSGNPDGSGTQTVNTPFQGQASYNAVGSATAAQEANNSGPLALPLPTVGNQSAPSFLTPFLSIFGGN